MPKSKVIDQAPSEANGFTDSEPVTSGFHQTTEGESQSGEGEAPDTAEGSGGKNEGTGGAHHGERPDVIEDVRTPRASAWNYLWIVFGLLGGIAGYVTVKDRDRARAKGVLIAGAMVSVAAILGSLAINAIWFSAVSQNLSSLDDGPTPYSYSTTSTYLSPTPSPSGTNVTSFAPVNTWTWTGTGTGGYSAAAKFDVGAPMKSTTHPYLIFADGEEFAAGDGCDVDPAQDAVVPFLLTVTNTTTGFATAVDMGLGMNADVDTFYGGSGSGSAVCKEGGIAPSWDELEPSSSGVQRGFVVLKDYYSPLAPNGDPEVLNEVRVTVPATCGTFGGYTKPMQLSPPGVAGSGTFAYGGQLSNSFYLSGVQAS